MVNRIYRLCGLVLAASALAACGGNKGGDTAVAPPVTVVTPPPQENAFGANFAAAFRASPTAEPIVPADGDIIPLSLTTDPITVG